MRWAVISDVHGNLEGLETVLRDARAERCEGFAFLGDYVVHGPNPKECVALVRGIREVCHFINGNADEYVSGGGTMDDFSAGVAKMILWTRGQLGEEELGWLRGLPLVKRVEDFTIMHGSLEAPEKWVYVFDKIAARGSFARQETEVCFFGHTHVPMAFVREGSVVKGGSFSEVRVEAGKKYMIGVGSAGQPRDGIWQAAYAVWDSTGRVARLRRCEYDVEVTRRKLRALGFGK